MPAIKNIIFDLGGVLLNLDVEATFNAFSDMGIRNIREMFRIGHAESFFKEYEIGKINDEAFITALQDLMPEAVERQAIADAWNAMLLDFPEERMAWVDSLRPKYRLFLFSNTNSLHLEALDKIYRNTFGGGSLDDHFEKAYYSHLAGVRKPELAAYQLVVRDNNLQPAETVFIDDALINIEGAMDAGLQGIHLHPGLRLTELAL